jgi:hypothetical protein
MLRARGVILAGVLIGAAIAVEVADIRGAFAPLIASALRVGGAAFLMGGIALGVTSGRGLLTARMAELRAVAGALPSPIESRLQAAIGAIQEARDLMIEVERVLRERQARLESLSAQYAQAEQLALVNRQAALALRDELEQVVKGETRRALWLSVAAGLPIGVAAAFIGAYLLGLATSH